MMQKWEEDLLAEYCRDLGIAQKEYEEEGDLASAFEMGLLRAAADTERKSAHEH
jgi:hypothetical protein